MMLLVILQSGIPPAWPDLLGSKHFMSNRTNFTAQPLRRTNLALSLGLGLGLIATGAMAQSNSSGAIFGQAPVAQDATIHIVNTNTGLTRNVPVDSSGRYRVSSLPVGNYSVTLQQNGQTVSTRDNVNVTIAGGSEVSFASTSEAKNLESISVVASALPSIDVSSVDTRTVLTAEQLSKIPVARSAVSAALLAPGVVRGDSRFGNDVVAMGGSGISENAYFINGYNVTNPRTNETFFELPFSAIDQEQVLTGGLSAEFGHSTGGVINLVGKRGTNTWHGTAAMFWSPVGLRSGQKNYMFPEHPEGSLATPTGKPYASDGKLRQYREKNLSTQTTLSLGVGGPLIQDKLFFYGAADFTRTTGQGTTAAVGYNQTTGNMLSSANNPTSGWQTYTDKPVKWYTKVDWNINNSNLLELTAMADNDRRSNNNFGYDYTTLTHRSGTPATESATKNNNSLYVGKYTGYITDNLTITALYGESKNQQPDLTMIPDFPLVRANAASPVAPQMHNYQPYGNLSTGEWNSSKGGRFDVEYRIGSHDLRAGVDFQTLKTTSGEMYANEDKYGGYWRYEPAKALGLSSAAYPNGVVRMITHKLQGNYKTDLNAFYVEDHWQVADRWLAYIGLRDESFKNYNKFNIAYVEQKNQLAPRLGLSWDVNGDSTLKVYANAGRYYLGLPNGPAARGAGGSLGTTQWFSFTGIDPKTDLPTGLQELTGVLSPNAEFGLPRDPKTAAVKDLKAHYQDEFILGADKQLTPNYTVGARVIFRKLRSQIDDTSDPRPVCKFMATNNLLGDYTDVDDCVDNIPYPGVIFNPGSGADFYTAPYRLANGNPDTSKLIHVKLSAADLGMPKPKRNYSEVNLYVEHPFDGTWFGRLDYTWAHSYGNTEGQIKSDLAQGDVASSQDWDFPEFMQYANGNLPNDRRHQLRAYGYWQMTPEWMLSGTLTANSGRPKNCLGTWFGDTDPSGYVGSNGIGAYHVCYDKVSPRGANGTLPWTYQLDLGVSYRPAFADHKLAFDLNVFNVTNTQKTTTINESSIDQAGVPNTIYGATLGYTAPRYVRFAVKYDFSF